MDNIVVIGLGNLGMRHLQSLCSLEGYRLYGVETSQSRVDELKKMFGMSAVITRSIHEIPDKIRLVVIATNSNVRKDVFQQLVGHSKIENIIFEKVLFQKIDDYYEVDRILKAKGIKAWVNCARREWTIYRDLKKKFDRIEAFTFYMQGGNWGLGCNAIHMLDLIASFSGNEKLEISIDNLQDGMVESKRKGFYEFFGTITGRCGKCESFQISCFNDSSLPMELGIDSSNLRIRILESEGKIYISEKENDWKWRMEEFQVPMQSQLTSCEAEEILEKKNCCLPTYEESMTLHIEYIRKLLTFFEKNGIEEKICPIT